MNRRFVRATTTHHAGEALASLSRGVVTRMAEGGLTVFTPLIRYYAKPGSTEGTVQFLTDIDDVLVLFSSDGEDGDVKPS